MEHAPSESGPKIDRNQPGNKPQKTAETWLLAQLTECPKSIAWLYHEWTQDEDRKQQRAKQSALTEAKKALGVESYFLEVPGERWGAVEQAFWRLPETPADEQELPPPDARLAPWHCRVCLRALIIEAVEPSRDGERTLTFWHCPDCLTSGVTPADIQPPPTTGPTIGHIRCEVCPDTGPMPATAAQQGEQTENAADAEQILIAVF